MPRPLAPAVLVFAVLAAGAPARGRAEAAPEPPDIDAARAGLVAYLDDHRPESPGMSTSIPGCPAIALDRLHAALAAAGVDDELGDWSTEIGSTDYTHIDPDLRGIVCGGDADGDAHDSEFGLAVDIFVVDADDDAQAQEVFDELGFGALEVEPARVPGGELASVCLEDADDGLALCLSMWSSEGFVVGVMVVSSEQRVPPAIASTVLADTLGDMLVTLAGYEPAAAAITADESAPAPDTTVGGTTPAGPLDVAGARAGLAGRLGDLPQIGDDEPLTDCPAVDRDRFVEALEAAGVDTPLESLLAEDGPSLTNGTTWSAVGVVCSGVYVGPERDESFPELQATVVVADFGDREQFQAFLSEVHPGVSDDASQPTPTLGGGTVGECRDVDRTDQCSEYWEHDGFVVGVRLADRVFMDRPTAAAVLVALVPGVVGTLAGEPAVSAAPGITLPPDAIDEVRQALPRAAEAPFGCPLVEQSTVDTALEAAGLGPALESWSAVMVEGDGAAVALACAGRNDRVEVRIQMFDMGASAAAQEMIDLVHGCDRVDDTTYCVEWWEQDGIAIAVTMTAAGADVGSPPVRAISDALVPAVLEFVRSAGAD